ncbi:trifunctional transcriptional regulator/proline dehydrogenase/L-glutamate gamma-semialdehyde dehydrogenase [Denitromonas ohlonensis]|uniref:Bifunctional protein PutA n=2 Tax=Denitromonas TaxID=139331 RepID=A0A557SC50_9RHOO|nr:trifunctional transcriptional regulator/proline dehydrogenase/L-glutamate gamma-semialdehyde dehydrogenase [Denitromonas ohlonensis]TVO62907.1 trifunctional transcriptional regulator/proline dehydrogenase/L-glutamate gamma-semialdehyde dehydrogenase [Denitromonas ohlonensis]TVO74976.1 trifunctional transcriptional regulator/proline dehydrogenase/L-glutamate gamma-semialdehyde dehydrogenase [Denitromonas ohlonensis]
MALSPQSREAAALTPEDRGDLRLAIDAAYRTPEPDCVPVLVAAARTDAKLGVQIHALARKLVVGLREKRTRSSGVDALMKEFSLSSQEGVALMCLAEALLRVPDRATADKLIRDKIARGDWRAHIGQSPSLFVNAATWGLLVTGRLVSTNSDKRLGAALNRIVARGGEPLIRKGMDLAMRMLGEQFVTGQDIDEAIDRAKVCEKRGYRYSFDMLGEAAMTAADAERYTRDYETAIHAIGQDAGQRGVVDGNGISVKLSALHPRYVWAQRDRFMRELPPRLKALCLLAKGYNIGLNIDAEEADRLDASLDLLEALALDPELAGWDGIGFVVQAYQKRAPAVLDFIIDLARRSGHRLMIRLVKGAYWDSEIKRAQIDGLPGYPVYTRKVYTDVSYLACARKLLAARDVVYPQFATHNAHTLAAVYHMADGTYHVGDYEFQCLHGMGETLYDQVVGAGKMGRLVRIYAPVGSHETLLAYLVRRLLENGANSSFVNRIVDENVPVEELIADPVEIAARLAGAPHPAIALPRDLYGAARANSVGFDLSSEAVRARLAAALEASRATPVNVQPMVVGAAAGGTPQKVTNPARRDDVVGTVIEADAATVQAALAAAAEIAPEWAATPAPQRAAMLFAAADAMEADAPALIALLVREAGKTYANAIAEIREAVDFCRYYGRQAADHFDPVAHPALGPVVCISPWNFPLAIFTGQVVAALAAGNPVLAKPAEQTPLVAAKVVALLHAAGVPLAALQFLPGSGEVVGSALVADARTCGVMFTGSTEVARLIQRTLAQRGGDIPLIAETGGQNALIVDSTALPEQVVADVIASSYDSAGQRCSALRVLCLQDEIYDRTIGMLKGAVAELRIGSPEDVRNDIGPVIDAAAREQLEAHVASMRDRYDCSAMPLPEACAAGTFMAPTLIEITSLASLKREVFGPVLHVLRYRAQDLGVLVDAINDTGYGLTLGVHSRIDETIAFVASRAHVGNVYINRNIIGAVVGVQPFGGEGLSGTGPKAGGPLYLHRLVRGAAAPHEAAALAPIADPVLTAFAEWLDGPARAFISGDDVVLLLDHFDAYCQASMAGRELVMTGPTGEDNRMRFLPRTQLAGVAETNAAWLHQIAATLATGSRIALAARPGLETMVNALPAPVRERVSVVADVMAASFEVLLFDGDAALADDLRRQLAGRPGPIVSLLCPSVAYDLTRLVIERTVSINTAAAGGNASLMAISN